MMRLLKELWTFLVIRRKLWLWPIVIVLLLLGLVIALTETSVGPFIYTLF